eukprot:1160817-Pelagomonas_calceolata.AAC.4
MMAFKFAALCSNPAVEERKKGRKEKKETILGFKPSAAARWRREPDRSTLQRSCHREAAARGPPSALHKTTAK